MDEFDADFGLAIGSIPNADEEEYFVVYFASQGGLTCHLNAKHKDKVIDKQCVKEKEKAEVILHPNFFQNYLVQSAEKLAKDECYPPKIRTEFKIFKIAFIEEVNPAYSLVKNIVNSFDGNAENFYPAFYKVFSETPSPFKNLSQGCAILSFEGANLVLAHLTGASFKNDIITFKHESHQFTEKEKSIITYLSGYVFGTFFCRIKFSSKVST